MPAPASTALAVGPGYRWSPYTSNGVECAALYLDHGNLRGLVRRDSRGWYVAGNGTRQPIPPEIVQTLRGTQPDGYPILEEQAELAQPDMNARALGLLLSIRTSAQMEAQQPPGWLVDGLIVTDSLAVLYGPPATHKSFIALAIAAAVATGTPWAGRQVTQGGVLYQIGEGTGGIGRRLAAWRQDTGTEPDQLAALTWLPQTVNLLNTEDGAALVTVAAHTQPALVIIDTLARAIPGGKENAAEDLGRAINLADQIRTHTKATVLFVHHTTKEGSTMRGHSVLEGAADTTLETKRQGNTTTLTTTKQKDAEPAKPIQLTPRNVHESLILDHELLPGSNSTAEAHLLQTMRETVGVDGLSASKLQEIAEQSSSTFYRALKNLADRGLIQKVSDAKTANWIVTPPRQTHDDF